MPTRSAGRTTLGSHLQVEAVDTVRIKTSSRRDNGSVIDDLRVVVHHPAGIQLALITDMAFEFVESRHRRKVLFGYNQRAAVLYHLASGRAAGPKLKTTQLDHARAGWDDHR